VIEVQVVERRLDLRLAGRRVLADAQILAADGPREIPSDGLRLPVVARTIAYE
jgi:hypothetical protein